MSKRKTTEQFKKEVYDLVGNEYTVLGEYVNSITKLKIKHNKCNNIYEVRPGDFIYHNNRCPHCKRSINEECIKQFLDKNNIHYIWRKKFDNCKLINTLEFDFQIFTKNSYFLLEYDGIQHYEETWYNNLLIQQKRDEIKNNYCKKIILNYIELLIKI